MNIWKQFKINLKLLIRLKTDFANGNLSKFSKKTDNGLVFDYSISLSQEIKPSSTFENKLYNLQLASAKINQYILKPDEIFSFFKIIGNPNSNFKKSRTLINNVLKEENGGGICQVSGIIYHISLIAGLEILERHNHSVDIYTDETRFTPLGTDATIVYGYKDLRIKNNRSSLIKFEIKIIDDYLFVTLFSNDFIEEKELLFESKIDKNSIIVKVFNADRKLLSHSHYKKML